MPDKPRPPRHRFSVGDIFMCDHAASNGVYEAKILAVHENAAANTGFYTVHYLGWANRYDEQISFEDSDERMYNCTRAEYMAELAAMPPPPPPPPVVLAPKAPKQVAKKRAKSQKRVAENGDSNGLTAAETSESMPEEPEDVAAGCSSTVDPRSKRARLAFDTVSTEVHLTTALQRILSDDYQAIRDGFVTKIPAKFSIERIIRDYLKTIPCKTEDLQNIDDLIIEYEETEVRITNLALICTANGVMDYFNAVCGTQLLYTRERTQHTELIRFKALQMGLDANTPVNGVVAKGFRHTQEYGIVHLVRLLSKLSQLLPMTDWEPRLLHRIMIGIHDLVVFLNKNWDQYHQGMDMYTTSAEMKKSLIEMGAERRLEQF